MLRYQRGALSGSERTRRPRRAGARSRSRSPRRPSRHDSPAPRGRGRARGSVVSMPSPWPALDYEAWRATCDTLHAHTQVLGKLAAALAPPEPQLQHAALRLTARGWETLPLPAPDGSGAFVVALDLRTPRGGRRAQRRPRAARRRSRPTGRSAPSRARCWRPSRELAGPVEIDPTPQEVPWTVAARRGRRARAPTTRRRSRPTSPPRPRPPSCSPRSARPTAAARRRSTRGGARSTSP